MIQKSYNDGKKHVHVLSFGAGTQSTALLLMALKGEVNGVIPDYVIFSDTGWEPKKVYAWMQMIREFVREKHGKEIVVTSAGSIREDIINVEKKRRFASLPFFTKSMVPVYADGLEASKEVNPEDPNQLAMQLETKNADRRIIGYREQLGMVRRQCTREYKIEPVIKKTRQLLGYQKRQRVREIVHMWKGISTDEIGRVKPSRDRWIVSEHPLIDYMGMSRDDCIKYVETEGLGTPPKSSCIGCPFHDNAAWLDMKENDPEAFADAVYIDRIIRELPRFKQNAFLHRSCKPLDEVDFISLIAEGEQIDMFENECEGMCGI